MNFLEIMKYKHVLKLLIENLTAFILIKKLLIRLFIINLHKTYNYFIYYYFDLNYYSIFREQLLQYVLFFCSYLVKGPVSLHSINPTIFIILILRWLLSSYLNFIYNWNKQFEYLS